MKKDWTGLCKILSFQHIRNGEVIYEEKNIRNMFHVEGEAFMLKACFTTAGNAPPAAYYFGLDSRVSPTLLDTLSTLTSQEPIGNGYVRSSVSSTGSGVNYFTIEEVDSVYRATVSILTFSGTLAGYGPVRNVFLATSSDNSGTLIATNSLSSPVTLSSGDAINIKMSLSLQDGG